MEWGAWACHVAGLGASLRGVSGAGRRCLPGSLEAAVAARPRGWRPDENAGFALMARAALPGVVRLLRTRPDDDNFETAAATSSELHLFGGDRGCFRGDPDASRMRGELLTLVRVLADMCVVMRV